MSEQVTIEVDGRSIPAVKGEMLIAATDRAGIYIPRFCYHKHLSVAANCRMCLVEVERAPKPLPACATPVGDGMKVFTRSEKAIDAQRGTMEFLLINHPLDCPICDQGGECELQDLAMGYGADVGRYTEGKRVVRDKDVGPLIKTDMTRCIHCTRCVRFGEEIAGLRELGATGRGEDMEIGTYIAKSITSELSGNVIDLCPVGALTNRPYRYTARAWELKQAETISPHDAMGSSILVHHKGPIVKRVVPGDVPEVNQTWIADRDRYSVHALSGDDRLTTPRIKVGGRWRDVSWTEAFGAAVDGLRAALDEQGPEAFGVLLSPSSTMEEGLLAGRLTRGLGSLNIDHRLRQCDFSGDASAPLVPGLNAEVADLESDRAVLLVGAYPRHELPVLNIRLRKAALAGARVFRLSSVPLPVNFDLAADIALSPSRLLDAFAALVDAAEAGEGGPYPEILGALTGAEGGARIVLGETAHAHPRFAMLRTLARRLAAATGATVAELPAGGNGAGLWLTGAVPHRGEGGRPHEDGRHGATALDMLTGGRMRALVTLGIEPDLDALAGDRARTALEAAGAVVALSAFRSETLDACATVQLPIAAFTENEGAAVNCAGLYQAFGAAVPPPGDARPAWKVLRVLGAELGVTGFGFNDLSDIAKTCRRLADPATWDFTPAPDVDVVTGDVPKALELVVSWPLHAVDVTCRRSPPLAASVHAGDARVHVNAGTAAELGLADGQTVRLIGEGGATTTATLAVGAYVAPGTVWVYGGLGPARTLGVSGTVEVVAAGASTEAAG